MTNQNGSDAQVEFPIRLACVDTGSNGIRFMAVEFTSPARYTTLHSERVPIRLGHQVFLTGRLAPETMDATVEAFQRFQGYLEQFDIEHYRAVATSAVREARNGPLLVERIARETGIRLKAITGSEEARLVHLAVTARIGLEGGRWLLVDLGGGSVELSLVDDSGMLWSETHSMGSVRLLERLAEPGNEPGAFQRLLSEYVAVMNIPAPAQYWQPTGFIGCGGNIEALAALAAPGKTKDGVSRLPVSGLDSAIGLLARLSYSERIEQLGLRHDRADVILPAAVVFRRLAELTGTREILVPHIGVKEGVTLDLMADLNSRATNDSRQEKQLTQAAVSFGRRYMFDEAHGRHVARLAVSVFDQLESLHGQGSHARHLLKVAAILHDIGVFVAMKKHHKHTLYILGNSEIPGLSPREMAIVGNVARYHRKSHPRSHHRAYASLAPADRVLVDHLGAILRLVDGLDRQRRQLVRSVTATLDGRSLRLSADCAGDVLLERWTVDQKKGLFEEIFGLRVVIDF